MPRKPRIEYEGAVYHVISRGNYRLDVFAQAGARAAFLKCLDEASVKAGWVLHAWCVMSNHYHLCLETPQANLVAGMKWLQSTFSIRFNRLRNERGHVFQGRYKALPVDPDGVAAVGHYIHLNPVRAGVRTLATVAEWPWSSMRWLVKSQERPSWYSPKACLAHAGGLRDTAADRRKYLEYLGWLQEDEEGKKALRFEQMSKGWALGGRDFRKTLLRSKGLQVVLSCGGSAGAYTAADRGLAEELWEERVQDCLKALRKAEHEVNADSKGAPWKVAVAAALKASTTAGNPWLAQRLNMGSPFRMCRLVSDCRANPRKYVPFVENLFAGQGAKCKV